MPDAARNLPDIQQIPKPANWNDEPSKPRRIVSRHPTQGEIAMNNSFAIRSSLMMALGAGGMSVALAQKPVGLPDNYPNKPVRIIVNAAPGGSHDTCGRTVATGLIQRWNHSVVVEN